MEMMIATVVFGGAFLFEALVTALLFTHGQSATVTPWMKRWAVASMVFLSVVNVLGWLRFRENYYGFGIDVGNWLQVMFALASFNLIVWVAVFHLGTGKWGRFGGAKN